MLPDVTSRKALFYYTWGIYQGQCQIAMWGDSDQFRLIQASLTLIGVYGTDYRRRQPATFQAYCYLRL